MSSNASTEPLCPDWVFSNNSNVHACKNRGWFTDYTPFESLVGTIYNDRTIPVLGVGTVILPTKKSPNGSGRSNHTQLVLHDVLHTPSGLCNIIGLTHDDDEVFTISLRGTSKSLGTIRDMEGRPLAYFDDSKRFFQVKLSGPPVGPILGPSAFEKDVIYLVNARWAPSELARWKEYKQDQGRTSNATQHSSAPSKKNTVRNPHPSLGYTTEEKAWLKIHYGNEWHFLVAYGLSIYDEDEREEGRALVRGFMAEEGALGKALVQTAIEELPGDDEVESNDSEEESEESDEDMEGNMVDYLFDEQSLRWMKKHYGTSMNYMYSNGLKFYDQDDCQVAQELVKDLMRED